MISVSYLSEYNVLNLINNINGLANYTKSRNITVYSGLCDMRILVTPSGWSPLFGHRHEWFIGLMMKIYGDVSYCGRVAKSLPG